MKNKNSKLVAALLILLLSAFTVGGTAAFLIDTSDSVTNTFMPVEVDAEIDEEFDGTHKNKIAVKNTGNIPAYTRVKLVDYWCDFSDKIVAKASWLDVEGLTPDNEWFYIDGWFYYPEAVSADGSTNILFDESIELKTDSSSGTRQVLEIIAEAVQAQPDDAVEEAWSDVEVKNGQIVGKE